MFALTAHLFACSKLLALLTCSLACSLRSLPRSWESEFLMSQNDLVLSHSATLAGCPGATPFTPLPRLLLRPALPRTRRPPFPRPHPAIGPPRLRPSITPSRPKRHLVPRRSTASQRRPLTPVWDLRLTPLRPTTPPRLTTWPRRILQSARALGRTPRPPLPRLLLILRQSLAPHPPHPCRTSPA